MDKAEVIKLILEKAVNNKIACRQAFEIADQVGWSKSKLGDLLNEVEIKIGSCQLGCFK